MTEPVNRGIMARVLKIFRPDREHGAASATAVMMSAVLLSSIMGFLRSSYIAWRFGAGLETDAYIAAFTLPDLLNYMAAGGAVSITFITLLTRGRAENKEADVEKAFHIVITVMSAVLVALILIAMWLAPDLVHWWFPKFSAEKLALCVHLTRILLPAQLFFYVGGVVSAVQFSQRKFLLPAFAPLIYNAGIIAGGVFLSHWVGIDSLAVGALAGSALGPFLVNAIGAAQSGASYKIDFDISHPMFREWLRMTIPLMLGFTVVAVDEWIMRYFASGSSGDISRINYAKTLFRVPVSMLGQAAGQASLPFFAKIFSAGSREEFSRKVSENIGNVGALSLLASGWFLLIAQPLTFVVFRRGVFSITDSEQTASIFAIFVLTLLFWATQGLYARAFYAASDTYTPMLYGTLITAASLFIYVAMFNAYQVTGLAIASNIAIIMHTVVLAILLHRRGLVRFSDFPGLMLAKTALFTLVAAGVWWMLVRFLRNIDVGSALRPSMLISLFYISICSLYWLVAVVGFASVTKLPVYEQLKRKIFKTSLPAGH